MPIPMSFTLDALVKKFSLSDKERDNLFLILKKDPGKLRELFKSFNINLPEFDSETESQSNSYQSQPKQNQNFGSSFGQAVLEKAKKDLSDGVKEDLGKNDGKRIREYFDNFGAKYGQEWCAAALSTWMKEAGGGPIQGSLGAREVGRQFEAINKWIPKENVKPEHLAPGNIAVWSRGKAGSGKGHIGVIESSDSSGGFSSIEGNSGPNGDRVFMNTHNISDGNLLGIGIFSNIKLPEVTAKSKNIDKLYKLSHRFEKLCKK